jgi:hypothetical protein
VEPVEPRLGALTVADIERRLRLEGVVVDLGLVRVHVRSDSPAFASQFRQVYGGFAASPGPGWNGLHVQLRRRRRWLLGWREQVELWHDVVLLHAAVVEREGRAMLMPALPGSGKSTLGAALGLSGWRLMSDEFGALDLRDGQLRSVLKPAALKNDSIEIIRRFGGALAAMGPSFPGTRKGTVAHLLPLPGAVQRVAERATPACVLMPRWQQGSPTVLEPLDPRLAFSQLAFNAFNYAVTGADGFEALVDIAERCRAWRLVYGDLDDAVVTLKARWPELTQPRPATADRLAQGLASEGSAP